jgi:hypothetical protein
LGEKQSRADIIVKEKKKEGEKKKRLRKMTKIWQKSSVNISTIWTNKINTY